MADAISPETGRGALTISTNATIAGSGSFVQVRPDLIDPRYQNATQEIIDEIETATRWGPGKPRSYQREEHLLVACMMKFLLDEKLSPETRIDAGRIAMETMKSVRPPPKVKGPKVLPRKKKGSTGLV